MAETVLFVGNGINSIDSNNSWESLLRLLHRDYYDEAVSFDELKQKPFPLVYEQIVLWQLKKHRNYRIENILKKIIAAEAGKIATNPVHAAIAAAKGAHIITANYEFNLMTDAGARVKNEGCVKELVYSVFRHFKAGGKTYWHLHGDAKHTNSINLGYEHYCGQLQRMREYTTGAYSRGSKTLANKFKLPLVNRSYLNSRHFYSWIDLFFTDNIIIKILGFRLEMEELDIWWLLTYRAKIMYGAKRGLHIPVNNKIQYFIPKQYTADKKGAIDSAYKTKKHLLQAMDVEVIEIDRPHSGAYYTAVLGWK
ncbi:MAG: hypothetical protein ABIQ88_09050 [Chitinophagaceae bacterium]